MKCDTVYCSLQYYYSKDKIIPFEEVGQEVFFRGRKSVDSFLLDMLAPLPSYRSYQTCSLRTSCWLLPVPCG